jgi:ankyrin repeat protein
MCAALLMGGLSTRQESSLLAAAKGGDLAEVKRLIAAGADVNRADDMKVTPLMLAARGGHIFVVRELLASKADPNAKDAKGTPVLWQCGGAAQPSIIVDLIAAGARVDERDTGGDTLLIRAAAAPDPTTVEVLAAHGANPNIRDKNGNTPLIRCAWWTQYDVFFGGKEENHAAVVESLITHGADPNLRGPGGMTALMYAAGWRHEPTFRALLNNGADVSTKDVKGRTALTWAARNTYRKNEYIGPLLAKGAKVGVTDALLMGDLKKARELVDTGGDLNVRGGFEDTPLMIAAEWGDLPLVKALLRRKVDVNARDSDGNTALIIAAAGRPGVGQVGRYFTDHGVKKGRGATIRALAAAGADLEARTVKWGKENALELAISAKNSESAAALIAVGAKPNAKVEIYGSFVQLAAGKGDDRTVLALLKAGANVKSNSPDDAVLGTAAGYCKPETLRALIRAGAPVNLADRMGATPLMNAVWQGKVENARVLLSAGAKIDIVTKKGNSALTYALELAPKAGAHGLLLKRGAKIRLVDALLLGDRAKALKMIRSRHSLDIESPRGNTPVMIACEWGDLELLRALLHRGAHIDSKRRKGYALILAACGRDEIVDEKGPGYRYHYEWIDHGKRGSARVPLVQELLKRGVEIQQADDIGNTALDRASAKGDLEMMRWLMDHGADPNYTPPAREFEGPNLPPLVSAAKSGNISAVELLLARGAKVNGGGDETRTTALSAAVSNEHVAVVKLLLSKGADPKIRDWDGWTILQKAKERKNSALIDLLSKVVKDE